jgi:putative ergosteryl-3beta-O-L-aspartate hydrolase
MPNPNPTKLLTSIELQEANLSPVTTSGKTMNTPRWILRIKAIWWRALMKIAILFDYGRRPNPPRPSFKRRVPLTLSPGSKFIDLQFYVPKDYHSQRRRGKKYPIVLNFHGGGFALGSSTDDGFWARVVVREMDAVFVSVGYRLAPEHPFPAAVDDGVDAIYYLAQHSQELGLDPSRICTTGFSAGGNLAITVPLRLQYHAKTRSEDLARQESRQTLLDPAGEPTIVSVISWYPILDFVKPRAQRKAASVRPDKALSVIFTDLFDQSYLPDGIDAASPYVSPLNAPDDMLIEGLPHDIEMFICEWDMLCTEGRDFSERLKRLGKSLGCTVIPKAVHAWDRSPNPFRDQHAIDVYYMKACTQMKQHFENAE